MIKDALKYLEPNACVPIDMATTIMLVNALKEALAQRTEQEPTAKYSDIVSAGGLDPRNKFDVLPQRTEPVACERCKQLEENAYDLVGKLRVANIKLSMNKEKNT